MKNYIVIVAPHGDDEIIGCFEILEKAKEESSFIEILYPNDVDVPKWTWIIDNPLDLIVHAGESCNTLLDTNAPIMKNIQFLFPDPVYETHPEHRRYGNIGERLLRKGADVLFYSVNMRAPYIRETKSPERKKQMLDLYYPEKADLWRYDHRYFLFEGQCKWIGRW